jgi:hypothetical protein
VGMALKTAHSSSHNHTLFLCDPAIPLPAICPRGLKLRLQTEPRAYPFRAALLATTEGGTGLDTCQRMNAVWPPPYVGPTICGTTYDLVGHCHLLQCGRTANQHDQ